MASTSTRRPCPAAARTTGRELHPMTLLALMREERPDVVLLDLIMPGLDGFQVLREKALDPTLRDIPAIIVSSRDPAGEPIVSDMLAATRSGGLSVSDLLAGIQALAAVLSPEGERGIRRAERTDGAKGTGGTEETRCGA